MKEWVSRPVIYNTRVLAKAEQRIVAVQIKTNPIPESTIPVGKEMTPISAREYFTFNQEVFDKVGYTLTSLIEKGNPNNKFDPSALNLTIKPDGNYNAIISSGQMPASAMTPNLYTLTIEAAGVRGGAVVSRVDNTVVLKIVGNTAIAAPAWTNNNQLNSAAANAPYPSAGTDLRTLLAPIPDLAAGDSYTFSLTAAQGAPIPAWVKIGGANNQFLVSNNNLNIPADSLNPTPVAISVVSKVSEKSPTVNPKIFYINILNTGTKPTWTDNLLPAPLLGAFYSEAGGAGAVNLANPKYLSSTGFEGGGTLSFACTKGCKDTSTLPVTGLKLNTTGVIDGTPSELNEIGVAKTFTVTVTNQATLSSTHDYTLWGSNPNNPTVDAQNRIFAMVLPQLQSKARGSQVKDTEAKGLKLTITGYPEWTVSDGTRGTLKFWGDKDQGNKFDLGGYVRYGNATTVSAILPGLNAKITRIYNAPGESFPDPNNFKFEGLVLTRQKRTANNIDFWDARDVTGPSWTMDVDITIQLENSFATTRKFIITVNPDDAVKFVWLGPATWPNPIWQANKYTNQTDLNFFDPNDQFNSAASPFAIFAPDGVRVRDLLAAH